MNEINGLCALLVGLLLGTIFFAGLWWTVRAGTAAGNPFVWFPVSLVLRAGLILVGLYCVARNGWQPLVLSVCGILIARAAMFRLIRVARFSRHAS